jgi:putative transposase
MEILDKQYTQHPSWGVKRMTAWLRRRGEQVNPKRIRRLLRKMGLEAVYQKPRLSKKHPGHKIYPYLLRNLDITRPNQVWCSDITYIRMNRGFVYLTVIMDWYSRKVLSWELSTTLDSSFCVSALEEALATHGRPEIFNTDQGAQYTDREFTKVLKNHDIKISMDGRGRVLDNIFVERLWRTVKYEEVYLKEYRTPLEARISLGVFFWHYNNERPHQSLDDRTPCEVYNCQGTEVHVST